MDDIAKRIEDFCLEHGIQKTRLGEILGVGNQAVYSWIGGRRKMDPKIYEAFCYIERNPGDVKTSSAGLDAQVAKLCDDMLVSRSSKNLIEKRLENFLSVASLSLAGTTESSLDLNMTLLDGLTNFIYNNYGRLGSVKVIKNLTELYIQSDLESSMNYAELVEKYKKKWSGGPLSFSDDEFRVLYRVPFSKEEAENLRKELLSIARVSADVRSLKGREEIADKISELSDVAFLEFVHQKFSDEIFGGNPFITSYSGCVRLEDNFLCEEWSLSSDSDMYLDFNPLVITFAEIDARLQMVEKIKTSFLAAKFIFHSDEDGEDLYSLHDKGENSFDN